MECFLEFPSHGNFGKPLVSEIHGDPLSVSPVIGRSRATVTFPTTEGIVPSRAGPTPCTSLPRPYVPGTSGLTVQHPRTHGPFEN